MGTKNTQTNKGNKMKRIHKGLYSEKNNTISYSWKGWELWETKEGITTGEIFYNKLVGIYQSKSKAMNKITKETK